MRRRSILSVCVVLVLGLAGQARALEELLRVDIGRLSDQVAEGYVFIGNDASSTAEPFIVPDVNGTGIDVQLETTYPGNYLGFRTELAVPLYGSLVHVNDWFGYGIIMTLGGLTPGTYSIETYHNNVWTTEAPVSNINILVNEQLILENVQQSRSQTGPFASALFVFEVPPGQDSAEIKFLPTGEPADGWDNVALNGFIFYGGAAAQTKASEPSPANQSLDVCPQTLQLGWKPGVYADVHDIYFGTSLADVNESGTPVETNYDHNTWPAPGLDLGTIYYWRIDEVNEPDTWTGDIWWFTTQTGQAFNPTPVDDERGTVSGELELSWTASCLAGSHNVYFGTGLDDVNNATTSSPQYKGNQPETSYPVSLEWFTRYYWRIDEVGAQTWKGNVWSFRTGVGGVLMWYDFDGMQGSSLPSPVTDLTGNVTFIKHVGSVNPGSVEYGAPNPVYNSDTGTSADFEPEAALYRPDPCGPNDLDILRLDGYRYTIEMWVKMDAEPDNDVYSLIEKDDTWRIKINENRLLEWWHGGDDSRYNVIRAVGYPLTVGRWYHVAAVFDFTALPRHKLYLDGGLVASRDACINNYGVPLLNPSGSTVPVGIGTRAYQSGDFGDFFNGKIDELRIQDVALRSGDFLTVPGPEWARNPSPYNGQRAVDPNDPNLILSWTSGSSADSHNVYFGTDYEDVEGAAIVDAEFVGSVDVNHYPVDANLELGTTYYWRIDEVNGMDVWKGLVWRFTTTYELVDPNLRVWYRLDETEGTIAVDYSGHELHGDLSGAANWDPNNGRFDGCLIFDYDTAVLPPYNTLESVGGAISISVWLYGMRQGAERDNWVVDARASYDYLQAKVPDASGDVYWRAGNDSNDVLVWDDVNPESWIGFWHHFVFLKDENAGEISIYFDGELADSNGTVDDTLANLASKSLKIGATLTRGPDYEGKMDDFRIYDRVLSPAEIQMLFRGGDLALAWGPSPYDGETDLPRDGVFLEWSPGDYAVSHNVYLGTDWDDVNDATTSSPEHKSSRSDPNYDPGELELDTTYYWRIDEVNDANIDSPWKGNIWRFTVANFLIIDDMESYNQTDNWISDTWYDGFENSSGAEVYVGIEPLNPAHGGEKSMIYLYYNDGGLWNDLDYYSEIEVDTSRLPIGSDWTEGDVKILTLFFDGNSTNDANEQMYVGLEDTGGNYAQVDYGYYVNEDMNDIKEDEWHEWNIALSDFTDVDANNVKKLYIGLGIRGNPNPGGTPGGSGFVYFDDARLYLPKCLPDRLKPFGDLTDDCKVDLEDVRKMAEQWVRTDLVFDQYSDPGTTGLVGWWKLDEGDGNDIADSSLSGNNGTAEGDYEWVVGYDGVKAALEFKDDGRVLVPDDGNTPELRPQTAVSASAWVYYSEGQDSARVVVKGADNRETYLLQVDEDNELGFLVREHDPCGSDDFNDFAVESNRLAQDEWIHIAGTFDGDSNTLSCYINGQLLDSKDDVNFVSAGGILSQDANGFAIGNRSDNDNRAFEGKIDDVRVYDRALSAAEVAWLASDGTGYVPLVSVVNIYDEEAVGSKAINFRDLAELMNNWREEELRWPE